LSVYVNGKFLPQAEAKVSVFDHGLLYGDGVFEGIRAYNGRVFKLERHMDRLFHSAKAIDLKIPHTKGEFANIVLETCRHNDIKEGYIRPIITRGPGDLGLDPRKCKSGPSIVVIAQPSINLLGKVYERGLKVVTSSDLKAIDLKIPHTKGEFANIVLETCRHNDIKEGYIRPIITRGPGDLGLDPRKCKSGPSIVVIAQPSINLLGKVYERGLKVVTSSYRRVPPQSLSPSIKSLNYLNNIMAKVEANQYGADEALMLDIHGYVSEASAENVFIVR